MTYISCFSDFAFYFYYYLMENCHTSIIISMWQNDLHTNTSRSVWPILYGLMIKMLQYKMYPAGELQLSYYSSCFPVFSCFCPPLRNDWLDISEVFLQKQNKKMDNWEQRPGWYFARVQDALYLPILFMFKDTCLLDITKTHLYNIDPLQPHFYIVKLGFTGV